MDKEYELKYHKLEEEYWWFKARRNTILSLIKHLNLSNDSKILEIGCSGGPLLSILKEKGFTNTFGIDLSENAIEVCHSRGIENTVVMDASNKMNFQDNEFDLIIASDILEHISDDISALAEWKRIIKPDGQLILFVPAFQSLWSSHDEINHHFRRYSKSLLLNRLKNNKLKIERSSYWSITLFFPSFFIRKFQKMNKKSSDSSDQLYEINSYVNRLLILLLGFENFFLKFIKFPVGVSLFAICRKTEKL